MADARAGLGNEVGRTKAAASWEKTVTAVRIGDQEQRKAMASGSCQLTQGQKFATPTYCALTLPCKETLND